MELHFFTFGSDHTFPNGDPASDKAVIVEADKSVDHRALFMAWLGSNRFAFEYTEDEFNATNMALRTKVAYVITAEEACGQCGFGQSQCHCIDNGPEWWLQP